MKRTNNAATMFATLLVVIAFVGIIAVFPDLFSMHEMLFQIIAVLLAVWCTAVVTNQLLTGQSRSEEDKDKNVKIHENKVRAYSSFMKTLWTVMDDGKITSEEIKSIRSKLFEHIFLYLDNKGLGIIENCINVFKDNVAEIPPEEIDASKAMCFYRDFAISIASCLKVDLMGGEEVKTTFWKRVSHKEQKYHATNMDEMWRSLEFISGKYPAQDDMEKGIVCTTTEGPTTSSSDTSSAPLSMRKLKSQAWHFCELSEKQLQYLKDGGNELSLIEYDEYWRTGLVKQVRPGDVVFLFKGNWRYAGVFVAKGWRVFEYDNQRNVIEITSEGIERAVVTEDKVPIKSVEALLAKYDIYGSYLDNNSTSCANVVVDTVSFLPEGVITPNTTYRKTISRYYGEYAVRLLDEFKKVESDENKKKIAALYD